MQDEMVIAQNKLKELIFIDEDIIPEEKEGFDLYRIEKTFFMDNYSDNFLIKPYKQKYELEQLNVKAEKSRFFPEISVGWFNQEIAGTRGLNGWEVGLTFPIWFLPQKARIKQAFIEKTKAQNSIDIQLYIIEKEIERLQFELNKYFKQIIHYRENALVQAEQLISTAQLQLEKEAIDYFKYIESISAAIQIKLEYIDAINNYQQVAVQLEYYLQ